MAAFKRKIVDMVSLLALAAIAGSQTFAPTDDICGYPHIPEQVDYEFLLVWGEGSETVGSGEASSFSHSMSYVQFDLKDLKAEDIKKVTLVLTHAAEPSYTNAEAKEFPIQVRVTKAGIDEKRWNPGMGTTFAPSSSKEALLAQASPKPPADGKPFTVEFDLKLEAVKAALKESNRNELCFALTSAIDPEMAEGTIYKFYARSAEAKLRPKLVVETND